ncbi:MAG: GDSL-type esterase/lipase family protein [Bacilli bacterium]
MRFGKLAAGAAILAMPLAGLMSGAGYAQSAGVVYVSAAGSDTSGNGTSGLPYRTINQAVQAAAPGSTIMVEPGTYTGMVTVTKPVTIQSDPANGGGATSTIIDATGQNNGIFITGAAAAGAVIEGLTIEHANNQAILVDNANDVTIAKNDIVDNGLQPTTGVLENKSVTLAGSSYSVVAGNTVTGNQAGGIAVADNGAVNPGAAQNGSPAQGVASPADANLVIANTLSGNGGGSAIAVGSYNGGQGASYNQIIGNTMTNNASGVMVAAHPSSADTSVAGTVVSGNTIQKSAMPGVIVQTRGSQSGETVTGTIITGNTLSGNGPLAAVNLAQPAAIVAVSAGVADTTITNNTISAETYGVWNSGAVNTSAVNNRTDSTVVTPVFGVASQNAGAASGNISIAVNGSALLTIPSIADGNQTFIPIWYVMSELKSLGLTSTWAKGVWKLALPAGVAVSTPAVQTGSSGNIAVAVNGNLLLRMNGFAAPNPQNGRMTTFAPISALSQLLAAMGIQNQVSAGVWSIALGGSTGTGTTTGAPPASGNAKSLVALGDSITFGYDLGKTNLQPSPEAFPYLIGKAGSLSVTDLGVPGLTSSGLLADLATASFQQAVKGASVITLDIGSNDLLQPAEKDGLFTGQTVTPTELAQFATVVKQFTANLQATLQTLVKLNPTAKIVVYNIYNPVPSSDAAAHAVADKVLSAMNAVIAQEAGAFHLPVANAYSAFSGHVSQYILTGNVHPNAQGQAVLAKIGEQALTSASAVTK